MYFDGCINNNPYALSLNFNFNSINVSSNIPALVNPYNRIRIYINGLAVGIYICSFYNLADLMCDNTIWFLAKTINSQT